MLEKQRQFEDRAKTYFDTYYRPTIDKARDAYAMILEDEEERRARGLSAIPSTKSTSVVDRAVERAITEYHGDPDAISYTAKLGGDPKKDLLAKWHTELFKYRSKNTFPFMVWHAASLTAGFVDGVECAMLSWKKEAYTEKVKKYFTFNQMGQPSEVPEEVYKEQSKAFPEYFFEEEFEEEAKTVDTWWIDQLKPGDDVLWDFKIPNLDVNMGQALLVKVERSVDAIVQMGKRGIIDEISREEVEEYRKADKDLEDGQDEADMGDYNLVPVWLWFEKVDSRWNVSFSIEGTKKLSDPNPVDDVFYNGRRVNKLPIIIGASKLKPWEAIGRGLPEVLKAIEEEYANMRNIFNDLLRQLAEGKYRVSPSAEIDFDALINSPFFEAELGEVERFDVNGVGSAIGAVANGTSALVGDINELAPVGMESSQIVPSGNDKTLGAIQLALGSSNEKLSNALTVRNETFMRPLLALIAEMVMAYETDEMIMRVAAGQVKEDQQEQGAQGFQPPQNAAGIDISALDFPVDVQINAGLGSVPRQQKIQLMQFVGEMGAKMGVPLDTMKMFKQGCILLGFNEDQFISQQPQTPPQPEMKATIDIDFAMLSPQAQQMVEQKFMEGSQEVKAKIKGNLPKGMQDVIRQGNTQGMDATPWHSANGPQAPVSGEGYPEAI